MRPIRTKTRTILLAATLLVGPALLFAPVAGGQAPPAVQTPAPTPTVNLSVQQRHIIKEIIKELKVPAADAAVRLEAGVKVPSDIRLSPMPDLIAQKVPQVKSHLFFVKDDRIALVNPKDNAIAEVIE
jgi:hypothetical protein